MNTSVRIFVRVQLAKAVEQLQMVRRELLKLEAAQATMGKSSMLAARQTEGAFSRITLAGKRLGQTGRILLYNFTLPLVLALGALEKQAIRVSKAQASLSAVYESTGSALQGLSSNGAAYRKDSEDLNAIFLELSNTFGVARGEVIETAVAFARAGFTGTALAQAVETSYIAVKGFGTTALEASNAINTLSVSYGLSGDQLRVGIGILGYAANQTRADVGSLTQGFVKAAPAAALLGVDVAHLASILAVMQQAGFTGAEAGTALNFAFTRLTKSTPESIKLMKIVGINITDASFAAADAVTRFQMVADAIRGLSGPQQQTAIATLFGVRQEPKLIAFFVDAMKEGGLYNSLLKKLTDSTKILTFAEEQLVLSMSNDKDRFAVLKTQLQNNFMVIANYLTPAILALLGLIVKISKAFADLGKTAGGRAIQALIVLGIALLALAGPVAIIIASFEVLIGAIGALATFLATPAAAISALVIAFVTAFAIVMAKSEAFRNTVVGIFTALAKDILQVGLWIYEAFQWMNPFAHHSPSLVERTRDGVVAMVGYWKNLRPALTVFDDAARAARNFGAALAGFTLKIQQADIAAKRADLARVAGPKAVAAYDALRAANARLGAQLSIINKQYEKQATVVAKAKARLDAANKALDAASNKLDALNAAQDALQKQAEGLGNPDALRSQAAALGEMGRAILEAGNPALAKRFGAQADALNEQAGKAEKVAGQIDALSAQIDAQQAAVDKLTAARDALNATYDTENSRLQLLADGYAAIKQQMDANTASMDEATNAAKQQISAMEAAQRASAKAAKGGGEDPFAQFKAGAGASFKTPALPGPAIKDANQSLKEFLAQLQQRDAGRLTQILGSPFKAVQNWVHQAASAISNARGAIEGAGKTAPTHQAVPSDERGKRGPKASFNPFGDGAAAAAMEKFRATFNGIIGDVRSKWKGFVDASKQAWDNFIGKAGGAFNDSFGIVKEVIDTLGGALGDLGNTIAKRVRPMLDYIMKFWTDNGAQIGTIVGAIVGFFLDWYNMLAKVAIFVFKVLWPVFRTLVDGILEIFQGLFQVLGGLIQFFVQLFTGHFGKALDGLLDVVKGLGHIIWGALKAIGSAIVLLLAGLLASFLPEVGVLLSGLAKILWKGVKFLPKVFGFLLKMVGKIFEGIGGLLWGLVRRIPHILADLPGAFEDAFMWVLARVPEWLGKALEGIWNFVTWIGNAFLQGLSELAPKLVDGITTGFADLVNFIGQLPQNLWHLFTDAVGAIWDLAGVMHNKIAEWAPKIASALAEFAGKIPGWIWDAITALAKTVWDLAGYFHVKIAEWSPKVMKALKDFAGHIPGWIWDAIKALAKTVWDLAGVIHNKIVEWTPKVLKAMKDFAGKIPGWIWDAITATFSTTFDLVTLIGGAIAGATADIAGKFASLAGDLVTGLVNGLKNGASRIGQAIKDYVIDKIPGPIRKALGISSPSKVMMGIGGHVIDGLAMGLVGNSSTVANAMTEVAKRVTEAQYTLPVISQNVRFNYLNAPLSTLPQVAMNAAVAANGVVSAQGVAGTAVPVSQTANSTTVNHNYDVDMHLEGGAAVDPAAISAHLGWAVGTRTS